MELGTPDAARVAVIDVNPPDCPAQKGQGTDIVAADFALAVRDEPDLVGGPVTQIAGYFCLPGQVRQKDLAVNGLVTAVVVVPAGSPAARAARQVRGDPALLARAGDTLRTAVAACHCRAEAQCPVLNAAGLRLALNTATASALFSVSEG